MSKIEEQVQPAKASVESDQNVSLPAQASGDVEQVRRLQTEYVNLVGVTQTSRKGGDGHGQEKGGA